MGCGGFHSIYPFKKLIIYWRCRKLVQLDLDVAAYLVGALNDGGCYELRYSGGRKEYRCVWVQKNREWLLESVAPRLQKLLTELGVKAKIALITSGTRNELRVSNKELYKYFQKLLSNVYRALQYSNRNARIEWLRGLYDAEGDKSCRRIRIWNKNYGILELAKEIMAENGIPAYGPYLDDKRHKVYVIEIPSSTRKLFLKVFSPEHPKIHYLCAHPR